MLQMGLHVKKPKPIQYHLGEPSHYIKYLFFISKLLCLHVMRYIKRMKHRWLQGVDKEANDFHLQ